MIFLWGDIWCIMQSQQKVMRAITVEAMQAGYDSACLPYKPLNPDDGHWLRIVPRPTRHYFWGGLFSLHPVICSNVLTTVRKTTMSGEAWASGQRITSVHNSCGLPL